MGAQTTSEPTDLTPSEAALAKVLAAWEAWPGTLGGQDAKVDGALLGACEMFTEYGWIEHDENDSPRLSTGALALLARARKAGVL